MRFLLLLFFCLSLPAHAEEGCFDAEPIVERAEVWDFTSSPRSDFYLPTRSTLGSFTTAAAAHFAWQEQLEVQFDYNLPPGLVGIPYTVHRLEIQMGNFVYQQDFTAGCTGPGLSFYPRQTAGIPAIKLPLNAIGENGQTPVLIRIWGHL